MTSASPPDSSLDQGLIQVYTGDGKGKTTAALGLCLRAAGHGLRSMVIQFMKGNIDYGELASALKLAPDLTIRQMGRETFVDPVHPDPEDVRLAQEALKLAHEVLSSGIYDIVVLDEVNVAVDFGLIDVSAVLSLLDERPARTEVILTGRKAHPLVVERADLVTEMRCIKHYYDRGVQARTGIES